MSSSSSKCNDWTCRVADAMNMENFCTTPNNVTSYDNEESQQQPQNQNNSVKHSYFDDARAKVQAMILRNKRIAGIPIVGGLAAAAAASNRNNNNLVKDNNGGAAAATDSDTDEEYGNNNNNNNTYKNNNNTARIFMISGCDDSQTSADVSNVSNFTLPYDPHGRSGGACTSALLKGTYVTFV
jgi:hypothetical protein